MYIGILSFQIFKKESKMNQLEKAIFTLEHSHVESLKNQWLHAIHPLARLGVTLLYIAIVISFDKYDFIGVSGMAVYLIVLMITAEIPFKKSLIKLKSLLILVSLIGIANPFFDQTGIGNIGNVELTAGMISMLTLMLKGIFSIYAAYILVSTTSIENICYGLRLLHLPKGLVMLVLLIFRYLDLLLKEAQRMTLAYSMRFPQHTGLHYKVWGSLLGQLLIRSIHRAQLVYESMVLRGFNSAWDLRAKNKFDFKSLFYFLIWGAVICLIRIFPVFKNIGKIFI